MDETLHFHVEAAIELLSEQFCCAGCNDYEIPDTLGNRTLWDEYQAWNLRVPIAEVKEHEDYAVPHPYNGQLLVCDNLLIYVLRKATGLI